MRRIVTLLLALVCLAACTKSAGSDALVVGTEAAFPPFESVATDGSLEGFDIDLMRAFGAHINREVTFSSRDFSALIPDLQAGRIDAIASGMSRTKERAHVVLFSRPYARVATGVLVSTQRVADAAGLEALEGDDVVIAVQRKTTGEEKAETRFPNAQIRVYDREVDAAAEVAAGRAHALVYDMVSIVNLHAQHPETTRIIDTELGIELYAVALPLGSELAPALDAFLAAETRPGGKVDELLAKWLGDAERFRATEE